MSDEFPFLIAEVANCHGGDSKYMWDILKKIVKTSADAIKFQIINADELLTPVHSRYDVFKSLEFSNSLWDEYVSFVKDNKKKVIFDIFGDKSLETADRLKPDFVKIHATDFVNIPFIKKVIKTSIPMFMGTGGATEEEIDNIMDIVDNKKVCLQTGFQAYPTPIEDTNLERIEYLKEKYNCCIGFADHTKGDDLFAMILPCLAVIKGANSVEKHVMLKDRNTKYDWEASIPVEKLTALRKNLLDSKLSIGEKNLNLTSNELDYRNKVRKKIVSLKDYKKGDFIDFNDVVFLRGEEIEGEKPLLISEYKDYENKPLKHNIKKYSVLTEEMFS